MLVSSDHNVETRIVADIYQNIDGTGINRAKWELLKNSPEWTLKEYRNERIWVRLHWVGKYDKSLPAEYRHSHGVQVWNRVIVKKSEWEEETMQDKGWVLDPSASQTSRTKSGAEAIYEDMLIKYTKSYIDMDDDGETSLVEEGNELAPVTAAAAGANLLKDEAQVAAAEAAGVDLGGWS